MQNKKTTFLLFCISLFFHSCVSFSNSDSSAEAVLEVNLDDSKEMAALSGEFEQGDWPEVDWWNVFEDNQLSSYVETAIYQSPTMQAAAAKVRVAHEAARGMKSFLYPDLDLNLSDNWEHLPKDSLFRYPPSIIPAVINQLDLSLSFNYEIDIWGKNINLYRASAGIAKAQAAEAFQTMLILSVQVCKEYYNIQINQKKLQKYNDLLCLRLKRFELIQDRFINGIDNKLPLLMVERQVQEAQEKVLQVENELSLNRHLLNVLMGQGPDTEENMMFLKEISFEKAFVLPENLSLDLLSRRADVTAAIWRVEAEAKKVGAAKAAFYPNINLRALAGFESLSWSDFLTLENFQGLLRPALHLPIFKGGRLRANLKESIASFDAAVYDYNQIVLEAAKDVSDQISTFISIDRQRLVHFDSVLSALTESSIRQMRFQQGIDNRLVAIQAQEMALEQEIMQLDLERMKILTILKLIKALGGGYCSPKEIILKEEEVCDGQCSSTE